MSAEPGRTGRCAIAVMAKAPQAGRVKTRLVPPLTPDEATRLSACFLRDVTANIALAARRAPIDGFVAFAPAGTEALLAPAIAPGTRFVLADGGAAIVDGVTGIGRSLLHATRGLLAQGYGAVCLVNADSPTLPTERLTEAAAALAAGQDRLVLGAAEDGGYYLIGLCAAHADLFRDIDWSTARVADQTRARAAGLGLAVTELGPWYDVDDVASLRRLSDEVARGADGFAAPATTRWLAETGMARRLDGAAA